MPLLKRTDFPDKATFLTRVSDVLAQQGTASADVKALLSLANEDPDWWKDAEDLYRRRHDFEVLINAPISGPVLDNGFRSLTGSAQSTSIIAMILPIFQRLGPAVANMRIQGILIGLVASILGYLGINLSTNMTAKPDVGQAITKAAGTPEQTTAVANKVAESVKTDDLVRAMADKLSTDPELKSIPAKSIEAIASKADFADLNDKVFKRLVTDARAELIANDATAKIVNSAKVETVAADATKQIVMGVKSADIVAEVGKQIGDVAKTPAFTTAVKEQLDATLKQKVFTDQISVEVAKQVQALNLPKSVVDALVSSDDLAKKIATEVKKP